MCLSEQERVMTAGASQKKWWISLDVQKERLNVSLHGWRHSGNHKRRSLWQGMHTSLSPLWWCNVGVYTLLWSGCRPWKPRVHFPQWQRLKERTSEQHTRCRRWPCLPQGIQLWLCDWQLQSSRSPPETGYWGKSTWECGDDNPRESTGSFPGFQPHWWDKWEWML